jgi:hypothetical protein
VSEDESAGGMSDNELPELVDIPLWSNVEAIGTEGQDPPQPILPQHWVVVVQTFQFMLDRLHWPNHTFPNPYGGLEDSAG